MVQTGSESHRQMAKMKAADFNSFQNHISGWYISSELCDRIIAAQAVDNELLYNVQHEKSSRGYRYLHLQDLSVELTELYSQALDECLELYKDQYPFIKQNVAPMEIWSKKNGEPCFQLQKYLPGHSYHLVHCENVGTKETQQRALAFMTYLTDLEGGGTEFPQQNLTLRSEKGLTVIWPAYFTHPHVGVVSDQVKYIITGWINFAAGSAKNR